MGDVGSGLCCNFDELKNSLDGLESFGFSFFEDGQIASLSPESEETGEGEVLIH